MGSPEAVFWTAFFSAMPPTVVAICGVVMAFVNKGKINEVHGIVNSQRDAMISEIKSLKEDVAFLRERLLAKEQP